MQTKKQAGFTLIELMIVVAIVGILAAVAIPAYQDYIKRSKLSEVMAAAGACKTSVSEYVASNNALPNTDQAGCSTNDTQYSTNLTVNNATAQISIEAQNIGSGVDGGFILLTPNLVSSDIITGWVCSGNGIETSFLPASCRG